MHILIIGAGVIGTATALRLAREGHEVDVFEAGPSHAEGTSFANAGLISPGHSFSWAEPGAISGFLRTLVRGGDGLGVTRPLDPALWGWGLKFSAHCTHARWLEDSRAALALSAYSRDQHFDPESPPMSEYGGARNGILYLYGDGHAARDVERRMLDDAGEPYALLDADRIAEKEPLLRTAGKRFASGLFCPNDATGNAYAFTGAALAQARTLGARFHFNRRVTAIEQADGRITGVQTEQGATKAEMVVLAAGLASAPLARRLGYRLPIYPVTGYSLTYEHDGSMQPRVGAVSVADKIAWAGFGDRTVRFTGFADIGPAGSPARTEARFASLERFAATMLPGLKTLTPKRWVGQRPMTPDCIPVLGAGEHRNLLFNCGHGAMGWTMSSGCAQIIADMVAQREPAIACAPYRWNRLQ